MPTRLSRASADACLQAAGPDTAYRGPPLRVTNPERFAAFLRESAAFAEAKLEAEDAQERARAARTGERYRTRAERAAAEEQARREADAARQQRRQHGAEGAGEADSVARRFDPDIDYYEVLGVASTASRKEIRRAYRRRALEYHPDKQSPDAGADVVEAAAAVFQLVSNAAQILLDPTTRAAYDHARAAISKRAGAPAAPAAPATSKPKRERQTSTHHLRVELPLPLHAYMTGGRYPVALPGAEASALEGAAVDVQKGSRPGDELTIRHDGCTVAVVLRDMPDPMFRRSGVKDLLCVGPPQAPPQVGDLFWARHVFGPMGKQTSGFACVSLLVPWLQGNASVLVRMAGLGLPDPTAPFFESNGDLITHIPLPLRDTNDTSKRGVKLAPAFRRLGAIVLAGTSAPSDAVASAISSLPRRGTQRCVCLVLGGADWDDGSVDKERARAMAAAACPGASCTVVTAPVRVADHGLNLLEDDWAQLRAIDLLNAPDVVIVAVARRPVDLAHSGEGSAKSRERQLPRWPSFPHQTLLKRMPRRASFTVVHQSAVAVRAHPSLEAEIIGRRSPGDLIVADARYKDWIRMAPSAGSSDADTAAPSSGEAWMLTLHGRLGQLLIPVSPSNVSPPPNLHRVQPCGGPPTRMRVCHAPAVAVRAAPRLDGRIVASRRVNDVVTVLGVHNGWARVVVPVPPRGVLPFGWMLVAHPSLGQLLAPVGTSDDESTDESSSDDGQHCVAVSGLSLSSPGDSATEEEDVGTCSDDVLADDARPRPDDVADAAARYGLVSALQALRCTGTHLVFCGGPSLHLCGVPPGGAPTEGLLPQCIVRESDEDGDDVWRSLVAATAAWHVHVNGLGLSRSQVVALTTAKDATSWEGHAPRCDTKQLRDTAAAAAAAAAAAIRRRSVLDALRTAGGQQMDATSAGDDENVDVFGRRRGGCFASGCTLYRRPCIPNAGPNARLLLACATCGAEATEHEAAT